MTPDELQRGFPLPVGTRARLSRMPRYRLLLEYDGGPFQGWQRQGDAPTSRARSRPPCSPAPARPSTVTAAGRTDAGVHALGQVAHLDLARAWLPERLRRRAQLPPPPRTRSRSWRRARSPPDFHARFSCTGRRYLYRILARRSPPALERGRVWHVPVPLDAERMHVAAQALVGRHDFTSFRASECQSASPVKTLGGIHVARAGDLIECRLWARSFLHHQVRNIVGTLKTVGEGKAPIGHRAGGARGARPRRGRARPRRRRGCSWCGVRLLDCSRSEAVDQRTADCSSPSNTGSRMLSSTSITTSPNAVRPVVASAVRITNHW